MKTIFSLKVTTTKVTFLLSLSPLPPSPPTPHPPYGPVPLPYDEKNSFPDNLSFSKLKLPLHLLGGGSHHEMPDHT